MNNYYPNGFYSPYNAPNFNGSTMYGTNYQSNSGVQSGALQKATNKIYVSGIEGARSYNLAPNSEVLLCDDTKNIIYEVMVDNSGKRTITMLDVKQHEDEPPVDMSIYATKDDIAKLREELTKKAIASPTINRSL